MDSNSMKVIVLALIGAGAMLLFGGAAVYVLWQAISARRKAAQSQTWQSVEGTIASSSVEEKHVHDQNGTHTSYELKVEYDYTVNGVPYVNDRRTLGKVPKGIPYKEIPEVSTRYAAGVKVPVWYNPENPQEACLEREAPMNNLLLGVGIFLLLVFLCFCCVIGVIAFSMIQMQSLP